MPEVYSRSALDAESCQWMLHIYVYIVRLMEWFVECRNLENRDMLKRDMLKRESRQC
jgi:hypothetical protein